METMTVIKPTLTQQPMQTSNYVSTTHTQENAPVDKGIQQNTKLTDMSVQEKQEQLKKVTEEFNKMSGSLNLDVKFAYNDKIDQLYLNVIDKDTGRIIRKLPTEEAMKIKESMKDLVGTLFDKKG